MFQRHNILLEVIPFRPSYHSGDEIYDFVIEILEKWDININNVHVFVHDIAANMGKAFHHQSFESVSCTSHTLQLAINDVLIKEKQHDALCKKVRSVVGHFKHSIRANKLLKKCQSENRIPAHKFIQDVYTRWNSTFLMLNRFLEQKKSVLGLAPFINLNVTFSINDFTMVKELVKILEIFHSAILTLSKENSTLSEVIPLLRSIFVPLETIKDVSTTCSETANAFILKLKNQFIDFETKELLTISTLLDPRFKDKVFSCADIAQQGRNSLLNKLKFVYPVICQTVANT
ncbi:zinc finger BED domain-containing protein 4-like [Acyrthosiphon pisum]|uniref:Uncharacterized protein n=1 Tax=Acyrthosiphon pisum TaxID=7029 RepID=A0A8R2FDY3_ACYPI|nr:zinc finger BED domain-containing protein 4-like [Acyrthosiphon pisum]|eukprot:XP_008190000.1 PREDICTED: zinc finger BED domain-containing protein 4-like [Acyrthosiphon pisum]